MDLGGTVIPNDIDDAEDRIDELEDRLQNIVNQMDDIENSEAEEG